MRTAAHNITPESLAKKAGRKSAVNALPTLTDVALGEATWLHLNLSNLLFRRKLSTCPTSSSRAWCTYSTCAAPAFCPHC